ncbi:hypothetical protein ACIODS_12460 [Micromonospora chalcea]|uniref:hypothetical protein n=1 Tax=Micromonospora chalcea TaxID=1874 RepID=UPI0037FF7A9E
MTIDINAARHKAADLTTAHTACDKDGACLRCAARGIELAGLVSLLCGEVEQWRATFGEDALRNAQQILAERHRLQQIVNAAAYEVGDMLCLDGECDHEIDDDAAPCPFAETRHATAAELLAVESLLVSSDGDDLDDAEEIPVGEIRRVLGEARAEVSS